jgi:hypothetical protein
MDRVKRLRRVGLLCCHFARNCAYYKASWNGKETKATDEFWATVQGNFIDISVLEWLKLFGNHDDEHHWKKVSKDPVSFKDGILKDCAIAEDDFVNCRQTFKTYRDKFVAHLDSEEMMQIPELQLALKLVMYYYDYVVSELSSSELRNLPQRLEPYYQKCFSDSEGNFGK